MPGLTRRHTTAKIAKRCPGCRTPLTLGDAIAPRRTPRAITWICASCDTDTTDLDHVLAWLDLALQRSRTPALSSAEVDVLCDALAAQGVAATRRGDRRAWHAAGAATAQFVLPALSHAHGLLLDAREHGFTPRLPHGYVEALLTTLTHPSRRAD